MKTILRTFQLNSHPSADVEELQAEDPFLEQPVEDIETINKDLTTDQKSKVDVALNDLEKADEEFAGEEEKDAAVETVLASRGESMKDIDANGDGVLDEKEGKSICK